LFVHQWKYDIGQVEAFGYAGQQVAPLLGQRGANGLRAPIEHPCLVRAAAGQ
jgi:hypothetical protein